MNSLAAWLTRRRLLLSGLILLPAVFWLVQQTDPASTDISAAPPSVSTAVAQQAQWSRSLRIFGTLVAKNEIAISSAQSQLRIVRILAEEGDQVDAGQILAELDDGEQLALVNQAKAELKQAEAGLREQKAEYEEARGHHARLSALGTGPISAQLIDEQKMRARTALARLHAAQSQVNHAQASLKQTQEQLDKTIIYAPEPGLILRRHAQEGAVSGAQPLFILAAQGTLELEGELPAGDLAQLQTGLPARIQLPAHEQPLPGQVRLVAVRVDPYSRLGKVRIALDETVGPARAGLFAHALLDLPVRRLPVVVPANSIVADASGRLSVLVVGADRTVSRRQVQIGEYKQDLVEIRSGLQAGEQVVAQAAALLRDGQEITPISQASDAP
ncbi:efflux RND transporter periplasmic adaptor subunit [Alcaligenes sp. SDU_A2]|uniref:efflux RND transporter periplasmic adaptor subunit n=1 Tax=Alcaligenes sp. SDU_A2 TaxID=3136634 RepID=UPI00311D5A8C